MGGGREGELKVSLARSNDVTQLQGVGEEGGRE